MEKEKIILIGGGDHCSSCIDVIEQQNLYKIEGILDLETKIGDKVLGYSIIGTDGMISSLAKNIKYFFITIGHVRTAIARRRCYTLLKSFNISLPNIISPLAYISKHAKLGEGNIVMPFALIDIDVHIGNNCIINHHNTIGHGATLEDHCHISANCVLGKCNIGSGTFVGGNSWVTNAISIAPNSVIGSASNVIKSIEEPGVYVGNPAKKIS